MEDILALYERPYDPLRPLICVDERLCQLIDDVLVPLPMEPGQPERYDYHYKRNGICHVFIAFEPLTGFRMVEVTEHRTKAEYTAFLQQVEQRYAMAEFIIVVQDNLNTHDPGSFYAALPPEEALALARRFDWHYTPPHASWLNMVEIELSSLVKQCLDRRIGDRDILRREAQIWAKGRNDTRATVHWQFTTTKARDKFQRFYPNLS